MHLQFVNLKYKYCLFWADKYFRLTTYICKSWYFRFHPKTFCKVLLNGLYFNCKTSQKKCGAAVKNAKHSTKAARTNNGSLTTLKRWYFKGTVQLFSRDPETSRRPKSIVKLWSRKGRRVIDRKFVNFRFIFLSHPFFLNWPSFFWKWRSLFLMGPGFLKSDPMSF